MAQLRKIEYANGGTEGSSGGGAVPLANTLVKTKVEPAKCDSCKRSIREKDGAVRIDGHTFHMACFVCSKCKATLKEQKVFQENATGMLCESCFLAACARCTRCNREITDSVVSLSAAEKFHRDCFCCEGPCGGPLGEAFYEHAGKRYCKQDYLIAVAPTCTKCATPICAESSGSVPQILFRGAPFHLDCFVCDECGSTLDTVSASAGTGSRNGPATESDKLLSTPATAGRHSTKAAATKVTKEYFPMDGQKLCKQCAKARAKKKKADKDAANKSGSNKATSSSK